MARWMWILMIVAACGPSATRIEHQPPPPKASTPLELGFDLDQWNGEVEWALVEECALLGLSNCAVRIESLKLAECTVPGARRLLESLAGATPAGHRWTIDTTFQRGDCSELEEDAWEITEP